MVHPGKKVSLENSPVILVELPFTRINVSQCWNEVGMIMGSLRVE